MKDQPACGNCRYCVPADDQSGGDCHRYPPTTLTDGESVISVWASVELDDVCGEWKAGQ
jgi:hypothetical protein